MPKWVSCPCSLACGLWFWYKHELADLAVRRFGSLWLIYSFILLLPVWTAEFPRMVMACRLGPSLSALCRICCACWAQSLDGSWQQCCAYCCWFTRDFRPAAMASPNPLIKYYNDQVIYLFNYIIKLKTIWRWKWKNDLPMVVNCG